MVESSNRLVFALPRKRQVLLDAIFIRGIHAGQSAQRAAAFGILGLRQMAPARAGAQDLAAGGDLEPLGHGLLRLDAFGTSHKSNSSTQKERAIYVSPARCARDYFV